MKLKLTDEVIKNKKPIEDKIQYFGDIEVPGLVLVVPKLSKKKKEVVKTFYFNYRSASHGPTKELIGRYGAITLKAARRQARLIAARAIEKKDRYTLRKDIGKGHTLRSLCEDFFNKRLKEPNYKSKTISGMKNTIETWVFKNSIRPDITKFYDYVDIADKGLEEINYEMIKDVHVAVMAKAPYSANRLLAYLKVIFNYAIGINAFKGVNPCVGVKPFREQESKKVLTSEQIEAVVSAAFVKDKRTNKLNFRYYYQKGYGAVAALVIAWVLRTGRRPDSEGMAIMWDTIDWKRKRIYLEDSKVGPMD